MMHYQKYIVEVTKMAGDHLLNNFGTIIKQHHKSDTHYDTPDDQIVSDIYKNYLSKKYPEYGFYSEEEQNDISKYEYYWMIDPIEGTTNYSHIIPFFGTQIALIHDNQVVAACVYIPALNETYYAEKGEGSFCNGTRISTRQTKSLSSAILSINKGTGINNLSWWGDTVKIIAPKCRTIRNLGAAGVEICYVSGGKIDLHMNHGSHNYDFAPGSLIAKEAGADVVNFQGLPWNIADSDIIIGNKDLVKKILRVFEKDFE